MIMSKRIFTNIALLGSIFFLNIWITFAIAAIATFYFKNFYEAILAGILIDLLYGVPLEKFFHIPYVATISFVVFYIAINEFKQLVRVYGSRDDVSY